MSNVVTELFVKVNDELKAKLLGIPEGCRGFLVLPQISLKQLQHLKDQLRLDGFNDIVIICSSDPEKVRFIAYERT